MVRLRVIIGSTGLYICMGIDNWIKGKIGCVLDGVFVCEWIVSLLVNSCKWCIYVNMYKSSVCLLFLNVLIELPLNFEVIVDFYIVVNLYA